MTSEYEKLAYQKDQEIIEQNKEKNSKYQINLRYFLDFLYSNIKTTIC